MSVDVVTQVEIARPRDYVASFASDPLNATKWYRNIHAVTWETSPPLAVGSRVRFRARFLGRTLEYTYEILEFVPTERLVMSMASGPFPMETSYHWDDTAGGTTMTLRNRGEPGATSGCSKESSRRRCGGRTAPTSHVSRPCSRRPSRDPERQVRRDVGSIIESSLVVVFQLRIVTLG